MTTEHTPTPARRPGADQDAGLWQRGLLLFLFVAAIAGTALYVALYRPPAPPEEANPYQAEALAPLLVSPQAVFPASVTWAAVQQFHECLPSSSGWEIRYNAALALARRGSDQVPLDVLREMLDEPKQMHNFRVQLQDGRNAPDETAARRTVLTALEAFVQWHKQMAGEKKFAAENADLQHVYDAVQQLTQSSNLVLRTEAEKARQTLGLK
jgi:hypothetical protein